MTKKEADLKDYWDRFKDYRVFSANKSFFQLGIVWLTFAIIFLTSIVLIYGVTVTENYVGCMSSACFETFIQSYKLPIGVLSLLIPFGAIYAAQHRSEQTIAQIKAIEGQNHFANYYKHLEEFQLLLKDQNLSHEITNYRQLHLKVFPSVKTGDYKIPNNIRKIFISKLLTVYHKIIEIEKFSEISTKSDEKQVDKKLQLLEKFMIAYQPISELRDNYQFKPNELKIKIDDEVSKELSTINLYNYVGEISQSVAKLIEISKFCGEFKIPSVMVVLSDLKVEGKLLNGIPTDRVIKFNLPKLTEDGEKRAMTKEFSIVTNLSN